MATRGDEERYLMFVDNIIHGFYSPPPPNVNLTNGPGWPLMIALSWLFGLPLISITIFNAFCYYVSTVFLYKALKETVSFNLTLIFSFAWAYYYVAFQNMPFTHTETFTYLLISVFVYAMARIFKPGSQEGIRKYIFLAGFMMGFVVLTKVAFGFVMIFTLVGSALLWLFNRRLVTIKKGLFVSLIAFATVFSPYMVYIYNLTGRVLYWVLLQESTLYWASSPYKEEYGDWKLELKQGVEMGNYNIPGVTDSLVAHHQADYDAIYKYSGVEQDDMWKKKAMERTSKHPMKYLQNCVYNVGRLVFHLSLLWLCAAAKVLLVFPANGIILTLMLFCLIPTFINWRKLNYGVRYMFTLYFFIPGAKFHGNSLCENVHCNSSDPVLLVCYDIW